MTIDIFKFCSPDDSRIYLSQPFQLNGRTIACNGHIFVSMPKHGNYPELPEEYLSKFQTILGKNPKKEFVQLPDNLVFPETNTCSDCQTLGKSTQKKCPECDGDGAVFWSSGFNDYEADCQSCDGDGIIITSGGDKTCLRCLGTGHVYRLDSYVDVLGLWINPNYLNLIIDEPGLVISIDTKENKMDFRSDENFGIISAINHSKATP
jgi:hypothetical protein